ncbi:MAG: tyrosine-type recombinase/integrase [Parvularculaceae bacterium]|nr:tyrosine-type recombinase/integrase [Parvularculaceae bacterium]
MSKRPPYVYEERDRHGKVRYRYERRVKGGKVKRWMPHMDSDPAGFWQLYSKLQEETAPGGATPAPAVSIEAVADSYMKSRAFQELKETTRKAYTSRVRLFVRKFGFLEGQHVPLRAFTKERVDRLMSPEVTPGRGAANNLRRTLDALFEHAIEVKIDPLISTNPVKAVKRPKLGDGTTPWSLSEIAQYQNHWPIGTMERLMQEVYYRTSQRRSDVAQMRVDRLERFPRPDGREVAFLPLGERQEKTGDDLVVMFRPRLLWLIDQTPRTGPFVLENKRGGPFTAETLGNAFRDAVRAADIQDRSAHGLRKSRLTHRALQGDSTHEIMALSGHASLQQAENYTRTAARRKLLEGMEDDPDDSEVPVG